MSAVQLQPDVVADTFRDMLDSEIVCERDGAGLLIDTPYVIGDGYLLRAYLRADDGQITVSDGGFATAQVERHIQGEVALRQRYHELNRIARRYGLAWDGEFSYTDQSLEEAMRRLKLLARALQESAGLAVTRKHRGERGIATDLARAMKERGVTVARNAKIKVWGRERPVRVDLQLELKLHRAVVEVLDAVTEPAVENQVARAVANFHALKNGEYGGRMVAVYSEHQLAGAPQFREYFELAKPREALLLPDSKASEAILDLLAA